jgi:short-subunit dehydrogenase
MQLEGKTALLTGATGGIATALARQLAVAGVRLVLNSRDAAALQSMVLELEGRGHTFFAADLTDAGQRADLVQYAINESVDMLINAAGVNQLNLLEDMHEDDIGNTLAINLLAPMMLCRDLTPHLKATKGSAIVNIGSILGSIGYAGSTAYCASKFGMRGFSEALRRELADCVQVIYFAPRATDTQINSAAMQALNKELGTHTDSPELVANALVKVLQKERAHSHYLGWPESFFVRLNGLFPKLVDKALLKQLATIRRYARQI